MFQVLSVMHCVNVWLNFNRCNNEQHPLNTVGKTTFWNWNNLDILRGEFTPGTWWDEGSQSYVPNCQVESRFASQFYGENTVFKLWQFTFCYAWCALWPRYRSHAGLALGQVINKSGTGLFSESVRWPCNILYPLNKTVLRWFAKPWSRVAVKTEQNKTNNTTAAAGGVLHSGSLSHNIESYCSRYQILLQRSHSPDKQSVCEGTMVKRFLADLQCRKQMEVFYPPWWLYLGHEPTSQLPCRRICSTFARWHPNLSV